MDDVFARLLDAVDIPAADRAATLATLQTLKGQYPHETPARLLHRARREGAAIPTSRCIHGVRRGECVACDSKVGPRLYVTAGDDLVHTTPLCAALAARGGKREGVEVLADAEGRERCPICVKSSPRPRVARTTATKAATPRAKPVRALVPKIGPEELKEASPPNVGDYITWGGYSGTVLDVGEKGVSLSVDGVKMTAPWGDRATVRKP